MPGAVATVQIKGAKGLYGGSVDTEESRCREGDLAGEATAEGPDGLRTASGGATDQRDNRQECASMADQGTEPSGLVWN